MFERAKKILRKLFGLEEAKVKVMAEVKGWPDKWEHQPPPEKIEPPELKNEVIEPHYPPSCHMIRFPERISKPGSQAIHKVSPKNFKPRTAHEKRLLKPKATLEEDN